MAEHEHQPGFIKLLWQGIKALFDQLLMILDLPTASNTADTRLRRLRRIYYSDPQINTTYRQVRDILRGHVHKKNYDYYDRMLSTERLVVRATRNIRGSTSYDILSQTQQLSARIVALVEQLEDIDEIATLYKNPASDEAKTMAESRQWLVSRIEEALNLQASIPAKVVSFNTSKTRRKLDQLGESIDRLMLQLDDILESYEEIDTYHQVPSIEELELEGITDEIEEQHDRSSHL
ncbi:MAG: hypothetical protein K8L91_22515 [Anaerolineae bacterium]|nr:hypothetical protein [Anaerolineae bacterium]